MEKRRWRHGLAIAAAGIAVAAVVAAVVYTLFVLAVSLYPQGFEL